MATPCALSLRFLLSFIWIAAFHINAARIKTLSSDGYTADAADPDASHLTLPSPSPDVQKEKTMADLVGEAEDAAAQAAEKALPLLPPMLPPVVPLAEMIFNSTADNTASTTASTSNSTPYGRAGTNASASTFQKMLQVAMAVGGGIGASVETARSRAAEVDLLRRVRCQDNAVLLVVLVVYLLALGFIAVLTYRRATNNSPVTFFSVPQTVDGMMCGNSLEDFLQTFNKTPQATLEVSGLEPIPEETADSIHWNGQDYRQAFAWSFDLSPWILARNDAPASDHASTLSEGMHETDLRKLHNFLENDSNDLAFVELTKDVSWPQWEELATNVKHAIRQHGFTGIINVRPSQPEAVRVHKNKPWSNFVHSSTTYIICCLSTFGLFVLLPYKHLRCKKIAIRSQHVVNLSIADYWPFIASKLSSENIASATGR